MAFHDTLSLVADADLSAKRGYAGKIGSDGDHVALAGAGEGIGIIDVGAAADGACSVRLLGLTYVVTDGSGTAIAAGDRLKSNGSGKLVKSATNGDLVLAIALDASTANGTEIRAYLPGVFTNHA